MLPAWLAWALLVVGITYALTEATIVAPYRVFASKLGVMITVLVYCPACTGFWVGVGLGFAHSPFDMPNPWRVVASGIGAMALMATWSAWRGGNPAFVLERELRGEAPDDGATEETHG